MLVITRCLLIVYVTVNPFLHIYSFLHIEEKKHSENIVEKGEIAQNEQFHFFSLPEHEVLMVSFCDRPVSVVLRASSTISLNIFSS